MLLIGQSEEPVDTAQQILDRGLVPFVMQYGYYWKHFLEVSPIPALQEIGNKTIVPATMAQYLDLVKDSLQGARTHVYFGGAITEDYEEYEYGKYYHSKDAVPGTSPYGSSIMNKKWPYAGEFNRHLLIISQVCQLCRGQVDL